MHALNFVAPLKSIHDVTHVFEFMNTVLLGIVGTCYSHNFNQYNEAFSEGHLVKLIILFYHNFHLSQKWDKIVKSK